MCKPILGIVLFMNESLENVKVGDKLLVRTSYEEYIETVERITATLVITKLHRYIKKSGKGQGSSAWSFIWAAPASDKDVERISNAVKRRKLIRKCESIKFSDLSDAQLEEFLKIVNAE